MWINHVIRRYLEHAAHVSGYSWRINKIMKFWAMVTLSLVPIPPILYLMSLPMHIIAASSLLIPLPTITLVLWARYSVDEVRNGVSWELPFFAVLLHMVHEVGGDITHAFSMSRDVGLRWISREWSIIRRYESITGSIIKALQMRAKEHPSTEFQRFITGYVSVWSYTGELSNYVKDMEPALLEAMMSRLNSIIKQIVDITIGSMSALVALSMFAVVGLMLGMPEPTIPLATSVLIVMITLVIRVNNAVPNMLKINVRTSGWVYATSGVLAALIVIIMMRSTMMGILLLPLPPLIFGVMVDRQILRARNALLVVPDMVRDISEVVRSGINLRSAMERIMDNYPQELSRRLRQIINPGPPLDQGTSWIVDFTLSVLNKLSNLGSPARALSHLAGVLVNFRVLLLNTRNTAKPLETLSYVVPLVFAGVLYMIRFMIHYMSSTLANAPYIVTGFTIPNPDDYLFAVASITYAVTFSTSTMASLFNNWTLKITLRSTIPLIVAAALLLITMNSPVALSSHV